MSRLGYIVAENLSEALVSAELDYRWAKIGAFRFATELKEDIRVINRLTDFRSFGSPSKLYRGRGFDKRLDVAGWSKLVDDGLAAWGPGPKEDKSNG